MQNVDHSISMAENPAANDRSTSAESPPPPSQQGVPDPQPSASDEHKCCIGLLYFSSTLHEAKKNPRCVGLRPRRRSSLQEEMMAEPPETVPAGEFKYGCLGYSVHPDRSKLGVAQLQARVPPDTAELPYCQGVQVVVAAETQRAPILQTEGANMQPEAPPAVQQQPEPRQRGLLTRAASARDDVPDMQQLTSKFFKTSSKVVDKMASNATQIVQTFKDALDKLQDGGKGGG